MIRKNTGRKDTMDHYWNNVVYKEALRGGELPADPLDKSDRTEDPARHQSPAVNEEKAGKGESPLSTEGREEWLEQWMKSVKTFIRNIDVNSL